MGGLLTAHVAMAVPLRIDEIKKAGGPTDADFARASAHSLHIAERGDVLLFGGRKRGEEAELVNRLVDGIAVLAVVPGGVDLFGMHFEESPA